MAGIPAAGAGGLARVRPRRCPFRLIRKGVGEALDDRVLPGLTSASEKLDQVSSALEGALTTLEDIHSRSLLPVPVPGEE